MGRSTSCFKIITCGSDSADRDDLQAPENKGSTDKRGWSFRKKSARHRVLSNTVISETPSSVNKESPESTNINFQPQDIPPAPEKIAVVQCTDEKPQLSTATDLKVAETIVVAKDDNEAEDHVEDSDDHMEESVVIVIQAAVRGFLAQKELLKLKNVVKLQAAVRGHLVRQHAIGTLRCVQAIVKMQILVRARHARSSLEGPDIEKEVGGKHEKPMSKTLEKEKLITKPNATYTSIEKLLSNGFAHQLMESTPKTRSINIKCDSSKPNSAWKWLERWMSVLSAEPTSKLELMTEKLELENIASPVESTVPTEGFYELEDSKSKTKEMVLPSKIEENLIKSDTNDFKFQVSLPNSSLVGDNLEQNQPQTISKSDAEEASISANSLPNETMQSEINTTHKQEIEGEQPNQPKRSMKRVASEELETEGKKFVYGSRKPSNPSFTAAQTKFEELSSTVSLNGSLSSSHQEGGAEGTSGIDSESKTKELDMAENSVSHNSRFQYGDSECGTELSVTSTLDSPDISDIGAAEYEHETKVLEEEKCNTNRANDLNVDAKDASSNPVSILSHVDQPEKIDDSKGASVNPIVIVDSIQEELKPERNMSDVQGQLPSETAGLAYRSSPEASPRSHITVPESQGTPSSQLTVTSKKNRAEKSTSSQKRKSLSAGKKSPSNPNHDSGARNSVEQLSKDQKNGKRHNSFGSTKPEPTDQEPRDSSSSSSLPHFMQATESARAKVNANNSPRSSPDVQDRDFVKKRHSLPGANGRQGSPRIQRSMSHAQQGAKGNGSHVVHERKWQR